MSANTLTAAGNLPATVPPELRRTLRRCATQAGGAEKAPRLTGPAESFGHLSGRQTVTLLRVEDAPSVSIYEMSRILSHALAADVAKSVQATATEKATVPAVAGVSAFTVPDRLRPVLAHLAHEPFFRFGDGWFSHDRSKFVSRDAVTRLVQRNLCKVTRGRDPLEMDRADLTDLGREIAGIVSGFTREAGR